VGSQRFDIEVENFESSWTEQQCRTRINEILGNDFLVLSIQQHIEVPKVDYPCRMKPVKEWCDFDKVLGRVSQGGFMGHTCQPNKSGSEYEKVARYNQGKIEPIDVIEDWNLNFNLGSVIKYICRRSTKDSELDNLKKAEAYIRREINRLTGTPGWGQPKKDS
jgi:hypothetical protein